MTIRVALHHQTNYRYDRPVMLGPQVVRLRPAVHCRTPVRAYSLKILPEKHFLNWQQDPQGNFQARLVFPERTRELSLEVDLVADLAVVNPFDFFLESDAVEFPFPYDPVQSAELQPYLIAEPLGPRLGQFVADVPRRSKGTVDFLVDVNSYVHHAVGYIIRMEPGVQTCEDTLTRGSGSCRDSAWLLVQLLRHLGLAARFVSGYLIQLKPDEKPLEGPAGTDHDFTDLHAWAEVYLPGAGWVGLDPTSGLLTGEGHLPLAATADPASAAPIAGGVEACQVEFAVRMSVDRIHEDPRVTKPYTDSQWADIESLGRQVDRALADGDVRLTMGGEPTFVSIDDMDGAEWNTAAVGPAKRRLAGTLFRRLARRFASGPLLHFGQGKWYPGESLPRWALTCYWRKDGVPVWRRPELVADDETRDPVGPEQARAFTEALERRLRLGSDCAIPGYEDAWYYLWKERRLPTNVDPLDSRLDDPEERARLARIFTWGLGKVVGYAVPLRPTGPLSERRWETGPWFFRQEHMFLLPGDSPMGLRLPLDSIPWTPPELRETEPPRDPFEPRGPLPAAWRQNGQAAHYGDGSSRRGSAGVRVCVPQHAMAGGPGLHGERHGFGADFDAASAAPNAALQAEPVAALPGVVRTAMCVEPRDGRLMVFMPPVPYLEDYLELVAAVEDTAAELTSR